MKIGHSADIKKNIRRVFWLFFLLFAVLIVYLLKLVLYDGQKIVENTANPRNTLSEQEILRGEILDAKGNVLATNINGERNYPFGETFAHLVGYSNLGRSGVESKYNFMLQRLDLEVVQRFNHFFLDKPLQGNNLVLTVDSDLQQKIYKWLGKQRGSVVVLEPTTGKILSMVSYPAFNPNELTKNWEKLIKDEKNSPLLNRATQGLYPPGSIFKIITAAAALENSFEDTHYNCEGVTEFGSKKIHCAKNKSHGEEDMSKAFAVSCNTFFSTVGLDMGGDVLKSVSDRLYFNKEYDFPLPYSKSSFVLNNSSSVSEIVETSIGQGKTLTTPVHMAMIVSAIANGGLMMEPYVVDYVKTNNGYTVLKNFPTPLEQVFTLEESENLKNLMVGTVENGTGVNAKINGIEIAAKTGTAENPQGADHGWFVAFAPADNPQIAVSIILENSDGPKKAVQITKDIINAYVTAD